MDAAGAEWLIGLIMASFFGLAIGNYATNPIYRLPRNESLFGRTPYCGDCNAELKPRDLFPVLSWLSTRGKCRYCGSAVPAAYVVAEALIAAVVVWLYVLHGFSESFILLSLACTAVIMLVMMQVIDRWFSDKTLLFLFALGAVYRVLEDASMYPFLQGVFLTGLVAVLYGKWLTHYRSGADRFPVEAKLLLLAGLWLNPQAFTVCILVWVISEIMIRCSATWNARLRGLIPVTATFAMGFLIPHLVPQWITVIGSLVK